MYYFVRRWEAREEPGDGQAWPFVVGWNASTSPVRFDHHMSGADYRRIALTVEAKQFFGTLRGLALRRVVELWVWDGNGWKRAGSASDPAHGEYRWRTPALEWTQRFPMAQRFARVAPSGFRRWRAAPAGVDAFAVHQAELLPPTDVAALPELEPGGAPLAPCREHA